VPNLLSPENDEGIVQQSNLSDNEIADFEDRFVRFLYVSFSFDSLNLLICDRITALVLLEYRRSCDLASLDLTLGKKEQKLALMGRRLDEGGVRNDFILMKDPSEAPLLLPLTPHSLHPTDTPSPLIPTLSSKPLFKDGVDNREDVIRVSRLHFISFSPVILSLLSVISRLTDHQLTLHMNWLFPVLSSMIMVDELSIRRGVASILHLKIFNHSFEQQQQQEEEKD